MATKAVEEPSKSSPSKVVTDGFEVLRYIDFVWEKVSPEELAGRFLVTPRTSQVSGFLHSYCNVSYGRQFGVSLGDCDLFPEILDDALRRLYITTIAIPYFSYCNAFARSYGCHRDLTVTLREKV